MPNKKIADLITKGLREGLMAPGVDGGKPTPLVMPGFRTAGMPKEMSELVDETAVLLGEAIVALIENEGASEIVDKDRMAEVAIAEADDGAMRQLAVHCRCDTSRSDPLMFLPITNSPVAIVDASQIIKRFTARTVEHPHKRIAP